MPIRVECPNCKKPASVPDSAAGKAAKCKCGTSFTIGLPDGSGRIAEPTATAAPAIANEPVKTPLNAYKPQPLPSYVFCGYAAFGNPETAFFSTWLGKASIVAFLSITAVNIIVIAFNAEWAMGFSMILWLIVLFGGLIVMLISYESAKAEIRNAYPNALAGLKFRQITPIKETTKGFSSDLPVSQSQPHPKQARLMRCDSCGAGITEMAPKCRYCGQTSTIEIRGVRSTVLLEMYLHASQWQDLASTAAEILKEHPTNSLAWAAKGVVSVASQNVLTQLNPEDAIKCFDLADRYSQEKDIIQHFRRRASELCISLSQEAWYTCVNENASYYGGSWREWDSGSLQRQVHTVLYWSDWGAKIDPSMTGECHLLTENANNVLAFHKAWRPQ